MKWRPSIHLPEVFVVLLLFTVSLRVQGQSAPNAGDGGPPPTPHWVCQENKDYEGKLLNTVPVNDESQCCGVCTTTGGCAGAVLHKEDPKGPNMCRLMGGKIVLVDKKGYTACFYDRGLKKKNLPPRPSPAPLPTPQKAPTELPFPFPPFSVRSPIDEGFPSVKRDSDVSPRKELLCFEDNRVPSATNKWWAPAVFTPGPIGKNYITQLPYVLNIIGKGIEVSYPWIMAQGHIVQNIVNRHWTITTGGATSYCAKRADELTATFQWGTTMESTILHGSPYITLKYSAAFRPSIGTLQGIRSFMVDGEELPCNGSRYSGHKFSVVLRDSDEQWVVWAPPDTSLRCESSPASYVLTARRSFSGIMRLALVNNCTTGLDNVSPHCSAPNIPHIDADPYIGDYEAALDVGSNVCTDAVVVNSQRVTEGMAVLYHFKDHRCWFTMPRGLLTMVALPHHINLFPCDGTARVILSGGHRNTRGHSMAVQVVGHAWFLLLPSQHIDWIGYPDADKIPIILENLKGRGNDSDINFDLPWDMQKGMIDPYNAGKLLAKMGRLVLIADQLKEPALAQIMLARLRKYLSVWLDHHTKNLLVYDRSWGGIISCGCRYIWIDQKWTPTGGYPICANNETRLECPTLRDPNFDFGNAYYNDHHFHYGYMIYSAAVIAKFDPDWAKKYMEKVIMLIRDIANPSPDDPFFTNFRYFDFYVGHSWALGIVADPNGKNQESTSEAVNAWYGIYLFGQATKNPAMQTIGETLFLMEVHSTNYYWHVPQNLEIYPKQYTHTMIGILHELLVEFQTYFGQQGFFVHGIQLLPITPVVHLMFHPYWVQTAFPRFKDFCTMDPFCTHSGFVSFLIAEWALLDKDTAWKKAMELPDNVFSLDCAGGNGNSRTNLLYFISAWGNHPQPVWQSDKPRCILPTHFSINPVQRGKTLPVNDNRIGTSVWIFLGLLALATVGILVSKYGHRVRHFYVVQRRSAMLESSPLTTAYLTETMELLPGYLATGRGTATTTSTATR